MTAFLNQLVRGSHHLVVEQRLRSIPGLRVPILWLAEPGVDGFEKLHHVDSLMDYFAAHSAMSSTWMLSAAKGLGLFYDYLIQNRELIREKALAAEDDISINIHSFALTRFQNHLSRGSFQIDAHGNVEDATGLFWPKRSPNRTLALMRGLEGYIRWLHGRGYGDNLGPLLRRDNYMVPKTGAEAVRFAYIAQIRKKLSFLTHVAKFRQQREPISRAVVGSDRTAPSLTDVVQFPRNYLLKLIFEGFIKKPSAENLLDCEDHTAKLVTMLLAWFGPRYSEAVQFWVSDFQLNDEGKLIVFMHNPFRALVQTVTGDSITREEYLRIYCGMEPRKWARGAQRAGWKGILTNSDHWAISYPLPFAGIEDHFKSAFLFYITTVRPQLMQERRIRGLPDHPFLFVSSGSSNRGETRQDQSQIGDPYSQRAFRSAWNRAMARIYKKYQDDILIVRKSNGTTPHGLRHLYGSLLAELGLSPKVIQHCLHHCSPLSQQTYTQPRASFINTELQQAARRDSASLSRVLEPPPFMTINEMLGDLRNTYPAGHRK